MNKNNFIDWIALFMWVGILCMYSVKPQPCMYFDNVVYIWLMKNATLVSLPYMAWFIFRITYRTENAPKG